MSYINGLKLYREIRKKDLNSKICLITAGEMNYDLKNKFYPVYNFIRKPIENKELLTTINNLVNKNKQSHQKV